jgi:hypothetical protein
MAMQAVVRLKLTRFIFLVYELHIQSSVRNQKLADPKSLDGEARLLDLLHFEGHQLFRGGEEVLAIAVHINFALA